MNEDWWLLHAAWCWKDSETDAVPDSTNNNLNLCQAGACQIKLSWCMIKTAYSKFYHLWGVSAIPRKFQTAWRQEHCRARKPAFTLHAKSTLYMPMNISKWKLALIGNMTNTCWGIIRCFCLVKHIPRHSWNRIWEAPGRNSWQTFLLDFLARRHSCAILVGRFCNAFVPHVRKGPLKDSLLRPNLMRDSCGCLPGALQACLSVLGALFKGSLVRHFGEVLSENDLLWRSCSATLPIHFPRALLLKKQSGISFLEVRRILRLPCQMTHTPWAPQLSQPCPCGDRSQHDQNTQALPLPCKTTFYICRSFIPRRARHVIWILIFPATPIQLSKAKESMCPKHRACNMTWNEIENLHILRLLTQKSTCPEQDKSSTLAMQHDFGMRKTLGIFWHMAYRIFHGYWVCAWSRALWVLFNRPSELAAEIELTMVWRA